MKCARSTSRKQKQMRFFQTSMLELCCRKMVRGSSESLCRERQSLRDVLSEPELHPNFCDLPQLTESFFTTVNRCLLYHVFCSGLADTHPVMLSRSAASNLRVLFVVSERVQWKDDQHRKISARVQNGRNRKKNQSVLEECVCATTDLNP